MPRTADDLTDSETAFLTERHLGTLTTLRRDGSPHVVAIAFAYDHPGRTVSIISSDNSQKVRNIESTGRAVVCQVDGRRWLSLEGPARVSREPDDVVHAVEGFERRYRPVSENPERIAIQMVVERVLGRA